MESKNNRSQQCLQSEFNISVCGFIFSTVWVTNIRNDWTELIINYFTNANEALRDMHAFYSNAIETVRPDVRQIFGVNLRRHIRLFVHLSHLRAAD